MTRSRRSFPRFSWWHPIDISDCCVPIDECITVGLGPISSKILEALRKRGFDQAPVVHKDGAVLGLVTTEYLADLHRKRSSLLENDPAVCDLSREYWAGSGISLDRLLETMSKHPAVLVQVERDAGAYGSVIHVVGLLTVSDLNRHPLRGILYSMLLSLEIGLARIIESHTTCPWDWIDKLSEDAQARLIGSWEVSKRKGVDVGPIAAANLVEMLKAVSKTDALLNLLEFKSRSQFNDAWGRIPTLRNAVMHPVRPMVLDMKEVAVLHQTVRQIIDLGTRIEKAVGAPPT